SHAELARRDDILRDPRADVQRLFGADAFVLQGLQQETVKAFRRFVGPLLIGEGPEVRVKKVIHDRTGLLLPKPALQLDAGKTLGVGDHALVDASRFELLKGGRGSRVARRALQAGMKEVGHLPRILVERAKEGGVKLVILLEELLDDALPDLLR